MDTPRRAHLLLQTRTKVLNNELEAVSPDGIRDSAQRREPPDLWAVSQNSAASPRRRYGLDLYRYKV